jgi:hypothetical protein
MKQEGPRVGCCARFELPDHLAIFRVILKCAEGLLCVPVNVEVRVAYKALAGQLRALNSLRHVIAQRTVDVSRWPRDQVASDPDEYAIRFNNPWGWFCGPVGTVEDFETLRRLQRRRNRRNDLGRNARGWSRS